MRAKSHNELRDEAWKYFTLSEQDYEAKRFGSSGKNLKRAQFYAQMATYEALILPGYGMSVGEEREQRSPSGMWGSSS